MAFRFWSQTARKSPRSRVHRGKKTPSARRWARLEPLERRQLLAVIGGFNNDGTLSGFDHSTSVSGVSIGFDLNMGNNTLPNPNLTYDKLLICSGGYVGID